jgi:hypothetical protein
MLLYMRTQFAPHARHVTQKKSNNIKILHEIPRLLGRTVVGHTVRELAADPATKRLLRLFALAVLTLAVLNPFQIASADQDAMHDQGEIFLTDGVVTVDGASGPVMQSVTTGIAGQLLGIEIQIEQFPMIAAPMLTFSLWSGGNPTTVVPDLLSETLLMPGDE